MINNHGLEGNWLPIKELPYLISDNGEVYSIRRKKYLSVWKVKDKYPRISISVNNEERSFCVHRLVAEAFIPNPENKLTVNHKDGNKLNNHVSNLEWKTLSENMKHAITIGLAIAPKLPNGEQHPAAKLNNVDVAMIRVLLNHDFTLEQIAKRFNVHPVHISAIKLGKTWKHQN